MSNELHIISFSGGADSTAMLFRMPKEFIFQDNVQIVFCNTTVEFPETYRFVRDIEKKLGKKIVRIRAEHNFEWNFIHKNNCGIPSGAMPWCCRMQKHGIFYNYYKQFPDKQIIVYIGFVIGEKIRIKNQKKRIAKSCAGGNIKNISYKYPLYEAGIDHWDAIRYCAENNILNPLYSKTNRVGCYLCINQSYNDWIMLQRHFPKLYQKVLDLEEMAINIAIGKGKNPEKLYLFRQNLLKDNKYPEPLFGRVRCV